MTVLWEGDIRVRMERDIKLLGSQKAFAAKVGITPAYLSDILTLKRDIGNKVAAYYGLKAVKVFVAAPATGKEE